MDPSSSSYIRLFLSNRVKVINLLNCLNGELFSSGFTGPRDSDEKSNMKATKSQVRHPFVLEVLHTLHHFQWTWSGI